MLLVEPSVLRWRGSSVSLIPCSTSPIAVNAAIIYNFLESGGALLVAFFINLAVVASNANEFFAQPCAEDEEGPFACIDPTALIEGADAYNASAYPPGYTGEGARCIAMRTNRTGVCGEIGLRSEVRVRVRVRVSQP